MRPKIDLATMTAGGNSVAFAVAHQGHRDTSPAPPPGKALCCSGPSLALPQGRATLGHFRPILYYLKPAAVV